MRYALLGGMLVFFLSGAVLAQTTRPAQRFMRFGQRIQELTGQLDLSDDQKQKIDDIIEEARQEFQQQLPALRDATLEQRQAKTREILEGVRAEIGDLLTTQQKEKLRDLIAKEQEENPRANSEAQGLVRPGAVARKTITIPATRPSRAVAAAAAAPTPHDGKPVDVGQPPPDVPMHWLSGDPLHISTFKKSVVVLVFGSYSSPTFRDKAAALSKLADRYIGRARFILIYTKEAHPSDGWDVERNKHDDIEVTQPIDLAGRRAAAAKARTALHLDNIPFALDSMDDAAATAYDTFPDGVVIIGKDGKIAARQHWLEPTALPAMIDKALKN